MHEDKTLDEYISARMPLEEYRAVRELPLSQEISGILQRAMAGYTDDYKHVVNGVPYVQWGLVQVDIVMAIGRALAAERERAAQIAADYEPAGNAAPWDMCDLIAAAIRVV